MKKSDDNFKPITIDSCHGQGSAAEVHAVMQSGASVLIVDDAMELKAADLIDNVLRDANRRAILPQPFVIGRQFKSRGKGTNLTPPKKKRKKRS